MNAAPLIVTVALDDATLAVVDALRRQHFPPERNHLSAHVTLFHHLPGEREPEITALLAGTAAAMLVLPLTLPKPRFLGRGVTIDVFSDGLLRLRSELASLWDPWLTPQDRQPFRPHVTIQNKVAPEVAKALFVRLQRDWNPLIGHATGITLSRYLGGPWETINTYPFG